MLGSHLSMRVLILKHTAADEHTSQLHTNRNATTQTQLHCLPTPSSARLVRHGRPRRLRRSHDIVARRFRPYLSTRRPVPLGALRETQPDMDGTVTNVHTRQHFPHHACHRRLQLKLPPTTRPVGVGQTARHTHKHSAAPSCEERSNAL